MDAIWHAESAARREAADECLFTAKREDRLLTPDQVEGLYPGAIIAIRWAQFPQAPVLQEVRIIVNGDVYNTQDWLYETPILRARNVGDGGTYDQVAIYREAEDRASIVSDLRLRR